MEYQVLKPGARLYPQKLRDRLGNEAPPLYYQGPLHLLDRFCLGVLSAFDFDTDAFWASNRLQFVLQEQHLNLIGPWLSPIELVLFQMSFLYRNLTMTCFSSKGLAHESFEGFTADRYRPPVEGFDQQFIYRRQVEEGQVLMLSVTEPEESRRRTALIQKRNLAVCALSDLVFIPYAKPRTKTWETVKKVLALLIPCFTSDDPSNARLHKLGVPGFNRKNLQKALESWGAPADAPDPFPKDAAQVQPVEPKPPAKPEKKSEQLKLDWD